MVEQPGSAPSAPPIGVDRTNISTPAESDSPVEQLGRVFAVVGGLITEIRVDQWSAPTPCSEWTVRQLVTHLIGMNRVFGALLSNESPPRRGADDNEVDLVEAFASTASGLLGVFSRPGILEQEFRSPMGVATGSERLQIRLYDLLAHGWDLAQATGQSVALLPEDVAERSLAFVRVQLLEKARPGRFGPPQPIGDCAPAIDRLVAFLGRPVPV